MVRAFSFVKLHSRLALRSVLTLTIDRKLNTMQFLYLVFCRDVVHIYHDKYYTYVKMSRLSAEHMHMLPSGVSIIIITMDRFAQCAVLQFIVLLPC